MDMEFEFQDFDDDDSEESSDSDIDTLKRTGHLSGKYKNDMIVWGGCRDLVTRSRYFPSNELLIYNPMLQKWSLIKTSSQNSPPRLSGACGVIHDEHLYVFGGYCDKFFWEHHGNGYNNDIYRLNLTSLRWERCPAEGARPLACDKLTGWTHGNQLYFFGGYGFRSHNGTYEMSRCQFCTDETSEQQQGWNNQLVVFDVNLRNWVWPTTSGPCPRPRAAHAAAKVGSRVYLFGGRHQHVRMNDLHVLDLDTKTWSGSLETKGSLPQGRSWHSLTAVSDNHLVVYGGFSQQQEALNECWMLTLSSLTWSYVLLPTNRPRLWHTACLGDPGEIIIFGGCVGNILSPQVPEQAEDVIILWFSPKSLLRSCLDAVIEHADRLKSVWPSLPGPLQELLAIRHANPDVRHVTSFDQSGRRIIRELDFDEEDDDDDVEVD